MHGVDSMTSVLIVTGSNIKKYVIRLINSESESDIPPFNALDSTSLIIPG